MSSYTTKYLMLYSAVVNRRQYAVHVYGNNLAISIFASDNPGGAFFAKDEDASKYADMFDKHGAEFLVNHLIAAGIEF